MASEHATGRAVISAQPAAVSEARRQLQETLERAGVDRARQQSALLLLSEVVTNAVKHGSRPGERLALAWTLDRDLLKITVVDSAGSGEAPAVLPPDEDREEGRGMLIVDRLADRWDERVSGGARQVSVRVRI
jgi:anti-sigma regulatory factor (Ser/Thr protein kinase)